MIGVASELRGLAIFYGNQHGTGVRTVQSTDGTTNFAHVGIITSDSRFPGAGWIVRTLAYDRCILVFVVSFTCNICGASNRVEKFATEPATCACGSNVRIRALIYLLSMELFNQSLTLAEFPR